MSTQPRPLLTAAEYIARERKAAFKSEYFRGETFAMAGASRQHNLIVGNIVGETRNALKGRPCEIYPSDMRVRVTATGLYTYPDATVVCGNPEFEDGCADTLLNPTVLLEVLSDSTEAYDRGTKSRHYRQLSSIREYVLIAQDRPSAECFVRQDNGSWLLRDTTTIDASVELTSLGVSIPMAEIYRQVEFPDQDASGQRVGSGR